MKNKALDKYICTGNNRIAGILARKACKEKEKEGTVESAGEELLLECRFHFGHLLAVVVLLLLLFAALLVQCGLLLCGQFGALLAACNQIYTLWNVLIECIPTQALI